MNLRYITNNAYRVELATNTHLKDELRITIIKEVDSKYSYELQFRAYVEKNSLQENFLALYSIGKVFVHTEGIIPVIKELMGKISESIEKPINYFEIRFLYL